MMIAIYLLKSILAMAIFLAIYRVFLEKEKMHNFNRAYLLLSILLSIIVPFLPTGIEFYSQSSIQEIQLISTPKTDSIQFISPIETIKSSIDLFAIAALIYFIGVSYFIVKFVRNFHLIWSKIKSEKKKIYNGTYLILLDEKVSPFTFLNFIFLTKSEFDNQDIDHKLLAHELTHAKEKHSLDIIFVELLISVFWFNPILRMFKTSIQLNHEFLADDFVNDKYKEVKNYQHLLLDTIQQNNMISLASNINFHLTQKRLKMMTKKSSSLRKKVLILSMIPMVLGILLAFGTPMDVGQALSVTNSEVQGDPKTAKDRYFEHAIVHYKTKDGKTKVISYKSLSEEIKSQIPPPPPMPPAFPGTKQIEKKMKPLSKGTVVFLKEDGSIFIGDKEGDSMNIPPPPIVPKAPKPPEPPKVPKVPKVPKALKAPKAPKMIGASKAVKAIKAPKSPKVPRSIAKESNIPPPPPPPSIDEILEGEPTIYINGKIATNKEVQEVWGKDRNGIKSINVSKGKDGKKSIHIVKK